MRNHRDRDDQRKEALSCLDTGRELLTRVRERTDAIGLAFSAGKDSFATLDLVAQAGFKRVEAYYLYRVDGLEAIERWLRWAEKRYGIKVRRYPHFELVKVFRHALLMPHYGDLGRVPKVTMADIDHYFRLDAEVDWIAYGWRGSDSYSRLMIMKQTGGFDTVAKRVFPLRDWKRGDVLNYLTLRGVPRPPTFGRVEQGGVDLHPIAFEYLRRNPNDWKKLTEVFPFAEAHLRRDEGGATLDDQAAPKEPAPDKRGAARQARAHPRALRRR